MNVPVVHYDIRAVTGVTRAACGIDNTIDEFDIFQSSNNRNYATCEGCRAKIDLLAEFGGAAIMAPQEYNNHRRWFIDAVKEAIVEEYEENGDDTGDWSQRQLALALKKHDDQYFLSQRKQIMEAVADTMHAGKFKLDPEELTRIINTALNNKLAEASYLVGKDFMESGTVKEILGGLMKKAVEEALEEAAPNQFVPDIVAFDSLDHQRLGEWASANDLVRHWLYDTDMVRSILKFLQEEGKLIHPGASAARIIHPREDEPRR